MHCSRINKISQIQLFSSSEATANMELVNYPQIADSNISRRKIHSNEKSNAVPSLRGPKPCERLKSNTRDPVSPLLGTKG